MKAARKLNFILIMRFWLLLMLCGLVFKAAAQENQVEGIVFDKYTIDRVDRVNIQNITTGKSFYNNLKGEFKIDAHPGDKIVFIRDNYAPDTIELKSNANLVVY